MKLSPDLLIAFGAGVLCFFSPCFLPLAPAYLIYITGLSFEELKQVRSRTIFHSLAFILGFTLVFTLMGSAISAVAGILFDFKDIFRLLGGTLLILLGLYLAGLVKLPWLDLERRLRVSAKPAGYLGSIFIGMVFAAGWTPCVGPVLAGILLLASQAETVWQGAGLLAAFSLGLALPLFLLSLTLNYSLLWLKKIEKHLGLIHALSGLLLVIIGILLVLKWL